MTMRRYTLDVRHTSSDVSIALALREGDRVLERVVLLEAWAASPRAALSAVAGAELVRAVLESLEIVPDPTAAATILEDACAFIRENPLEEYPIHADPGAGEAAQLPGGEDPEGEG